MKWGKKLKFFVNKMGNSESTSPWAAEYETIKQNHDSAYSCIDSAISLEEQEKPAEVRTSFNLLLLQQETFKKINKKSFFFLHSSSLIARKVVGIVLNIKGCNAFYIVKVREVIFYW